ncbi:MAG: NUDIX hydrolase [Cyanobacteria bacterium P01_A01_bin.83]
MVINIKAYWKNLSRTRYLNQLPKKRMGAGCLFFNHQRKILILKPTYKNHWLLPGGVIEANESPRQACIREVQEEIGIKCQPERLLCIDYVSPTQHSNESVQFIFESKINFDLSMIRLAEAEISAYKLFEPQEALSKLGFHSRLRLEKCLEYRHGEITIYLENGELA